MPLTRELHAGCSGWRCAPHPRFNKMTTEFQSCPGCDSFILSDTYQCPECGYILDEDRAQAAQSQAQSDVKGAEMYDICAECGESVRTGLVRCWKCNAFMREDVAQRYAEMSARPQAIIFSDVPVDQRTEFMPARSDGGVFDADADDEDDGGFSLQQNEFELSAEPTVPVSQPAAASQPVAEQPAAEQPAAEQPAAEQAKEKPEETAKKSAADSVEEQEEDLFKIAVADERETRKRKRQKLQEARRQRILLPCSCGAWIRVHTDQAGRVVKCRKCKTPVVVPEMKQKKKGRKQEAAPQIKVAWLDDVRLHEVLPTDVVLKAGSLEKSSELADLVFHESGLYVIRYAAPAKKSLFSRGADGPPEVDEQRKLARDHIKKSGAITSIPHGELQSIPADQIEKLILVQPVREASASMFAGVNVFGDGQIGVHIPLEGSDGQQRFLSFPISGYRRFDQMLQNQFGRSMDAESNGVPKEEKYDTHKCHFSEMPVKGVRDVIYYQNDPAFELELAGHVCATCNAAMTEDARAKKKLGGGAGKGLAKAKCPKCSNKFGDQKAWNIAKAPDTTVEEEEDVSEVLMSPAPTATPKAEPSTAATSGSAS